MLKHVCQFNKESMALIPSFPEQGSPFLVSKLDETKGGLKTVDKQDLNISLLY